MPRTVLITGCSTGFGEATARRRPRKDASAAIRHGKCDRRRPYISP